MKRFIKPILLLQWILLFSACSSAQVTNDKTQKAKKFEQLFKYSSENNIFNGSILIIENDKVLYKKSFGDNGEKARTPITSNSQFLLASLSKQFTAIGIMILQEQGKLNYDDKVLIHLPNFPYEELTIRQLLNQTSGIPEYQQLLNRKFSDFKKAFDEKGEVIDNTFVYELYKKYKPELGFMPNKKFDYSNTNYVFLALVIEAVSNTSFTKFMEQYVFNPLEMEHTFVYSKENEIKFSNRTYGYKQTTNEKNRESNDRYPFINIVGDGGIYSTLNDLEKWVSALHENTLLSKANLDKAFTVPKLSNGESGPYGFGWFVRKLPFNGNKALTHSGEFVGFSNAFFSDMKDRSSIIMLSNNSSEYRPQLNSAMVRILYNMPYELPKINIAEVIGKVLLEKDIESAINKYNKLKSEDSDSYDFSEKHLNRLGYDLLELKQVSDAIEIFKLNVLNYPESSNVYDSLGEAYLLANQKEKALKNYQKALSLNSENENAAKTIKKLKER
ncbi:serine hydrolase [uncultured Croceitalea sp.]|uniref:serine hydrolase n=1 Tax=uncultured Croceitalea sp. TaxID=1798908 RepID=UPI0033067948